MTSFEDGPGAGKALALRRAPIFLRVTQEGATIDALDQPEDTPRPTEKVFAYVLTEKPGMCHIHKSGPGSGFYAVANYRLVAEQPPEAMMRDNRLWQHWCEHTQPPKL